MNKIYKVIWSKVRNCYVAVSEIAKRNGKSCTSVNCGAKANRGHAGVALAIALSLSLAGGGVAWGEEIIPGEDGNKTITIKDTVLGQERGYGFAAAAEGNINFTVASTGIIEYVDGALTSNNIITIESGGKVTAKLGYDPFSGIKGGRNNNQVVISGRVEETVYGGFASSSATIKNVYGNEVTVNSGGYVGGKIYGGYAMAGTAGGTGNNKNTVTITGGTVNDRVFGGYSKSSDALYNEVTISGATIKGNVYGGYSGNATGDLSDTGNANNNIVTIKNSAKITGDVNGGWANAGANTRTTNNNTVKLGGATITGSLRGGNRSSDSSGNKLILTNTGNSVGNFVNFETVELSNTLAWGNGTTVLTGEVWTPLFTYFDISGATNLSSTSNNYGKMTLLDDTNTSSHSLNNHGFTLKYKQGSSVTEATISKTYPRAVVVTGTAASTPSNDKGLSLSYNQKAHIVSLDKAGTSYYKKVMYSVADNVTGITFGNMTWGTPRDGTASGTHFDFGGVTNTNITTTGLSFTNPLSIVKNNTELLLTNATNLAAGTNIPHSQTITNYNIGNGVKLNATLNGNVVRTTAGQIGYKSNGTTLNSVDITGWNGTASAAINSDWLRSGYVTVTIGDSFSAPSLSAGATPLNILTSSNTFFVDNTIIDNTNNDKYHSFDFTGDTTNHVTFAGTQSKGVKAGNNGQSLVYAVDKKNVTSLTLGGMTWGDSIGRAADSTYVFDNLSSITITDPLFTNPDAVSGTKDLVTNATGLAAGAVAAIAHSQDFTKTMSNNAKLSATLTGTVSTEEGKVTYTATSVTLNSVDLKNWNATTTDIPAGWTGTNVAVDTGTATSTFDVSSFKAGETKDIFTTRDGITFGTISGARAYSTATFSNDEGNKGVTLSGNHYKGVKVEDNGKTLKYYAETMDTDGITLGKMTWGTTTGRTAGDLYIFNRVNSIDATGFSFSNPDAVSGSMYLLSNATGLAANAVADISHTQADFTTNMGNGTAITATLTGTISTAEAGKVKYTATGTTISTIDLSGWDVSTSSAVPAGWTLKKNSSNEVEATVQTDNMNTTLLSNLAYGTIIPIITATGTAYFDGIKINGANAWNGSGSIVDTDNSGVAIIGTTTGTGVKVDDANKNQIVYQKSKEDITKLTLGGITFAAGTKARTFDNTFDLTAAPIVASDDLFTSESRPLMETGDTMTLVDATGAIKNTSNETLSTFNGGTSKSYVVNFTDTIKSNSIIKSDSIKFAGTHTDTLSQEDDTATSTKKSLLKYEVGAKMVTKATLSGAIDWRDGGTYYTNGVDVNENGKDATYTFDGDTAVVIAGVQFSTTKDPIAGGKTKSMTLLKGVTGVVETNISGTPAFGVALTQNNTKLDAKATGSASVSGNDVIYSVNGVAIDKINVTSIAKAADTVPTGWTLAKDSSDNVIATVETDGLVVASPSGLKPGETKVIIEAAGSKAYFDGVTVNGSYAWKADGSTITSDLEIGGVAITGTQTKGGVKVNEANTNQIIYEESKKSINTLKLGSVTFANDDGTAATVARTFDKTYDVSTATINADDLAFINSDIMETGNSMRIVDASAAIPNAISNKKLPAFTKQDKTVNYTDTISGKVITFAGTHTDKLEQDAAQTKLTYTVGDKNVSTATLNGAVNWSDGASYYTNGTDVNQNNVAATYKFDGNTSVDLSGVAFSATADPLTGTTKSMTLLKGVTGVVATKVSGTPSFTVALDQRNTKLDAKASGTAAVSGSDVTYTVSGVALDKITVKGANGTADKVPASWTMAAGATIETDSMTVPELAAGTHVDILQSDTDGFFAKVAINGANAYGNTQDAFTESDAAKSVTIAGTQDKGVTLNTEKKHLIYKAGTLDVASVTLGLAEWKKGTTVFERSGAEYNYAGVAALGTDGFVISYASPETVATGDSMTLLQANVTLKDMAEQVKKTSYSFSPVTGVTVDANITGKLATSGGAVTYTAAANQAGKLTFTNVDWKDSGALMTRPKNITFSGADVDTAKIHFQNVKELDANRKMTLVSDFGDSVGTITGSKYTVGAGLEGEGAASLSGSDLVFTTKTGARDLAAQEQTHNTLMVMEAGMAVLAAGNEYVGQTMAELGNPQNVSLDGTVTAASLGGSKSRYKTGSHVDSNNWNVAVAVGSKRELKKGSLEWGVFGEYGKSNYTLHSDAGRGDGDSHYAGGGLMAKWTNKHDVYTEASVRLGRLSDTASNLLRDAAGNGYGYDVHANYFGAHVGIGKIIRYKGGKSLDVYGKYFYTKRDGVDFTSGGNNYSLDSVASSVLRVGARYGTTDKKWNWYGGLAYEYEFDGKSEGTVDGIGIRAASVKGGSVRGEIGLRMSATKTNPWQTDISIYGYGGKHRGFGGSVNVAYMF